MLTDFYAFVSAEIKPLETADYAWDEWQVRDYITPLDTELTDALEPVSRNALIAFATAICVWIYRSLENHGRSADYYVFLTAAAASSLEDPFLADIRVDIDGWRGPNNGPFAVSMTSILSMLHDLINLPIKENQIHYLKALFCHIRPNTPAFEAWFDASVAWLAETQVTDELRPADYEPDFFDELDFMGHPVPLTAFVPGITVSRLESEAAFERQRRVVLADNPFV